VVQGQRSFCGFFHLWSVVVASSFGGLPSVDSPHGVFFDKHNPTLAGLLGTRSSKCLFISYGGPPPPWTLDVAPPYSPPPLFQFVPLFGQPFRTPSRIFFLWQPPPTYVTRETPPTWDFDGLPAPPLDPDFFFLNPLPLDMVPRTPRFFYSPLGFHVLPGAGSNSSTYRPVKKVGMFSPFSPPHDPYSFVYVPFFFGTQFSPGLLRVWGA